MEHKIFTLWTYSNLVVVSKHSNKNPAKVSDSYQTVVLFVCLYLLLGFGKNTGVGCHFLLQEIFPGLNPGLPHYRQVPHHLNLQEIYWQVGINPWQGFCHKLYEVTMEPRSKAPHLLRTGRVIHWHKHTIELVKYSRKHVHLENKELELQASLPCPEESRMSPQDERLLLNHKRHLDSWSLEKNSVWGQWRDLISQGFCVVKFH